MTPHGCGGVGKIYTAGAAPPSAKKRPLEAGRDEIN